MTPGYDAPPLGDTAAYSGRVSRDSTALFTDQYELTMLSAALADGSAHRRCSFEVFARRLPDGRRYGVVGGTARLVAALSNFRFGEQELAIVSRFLDEAT